MSKGMIKNDIAYPLPPLRAITTTISGKEFGDGCEDRVSTDMDSPFQQAMIEFITNNDLPLEVRTAATGALHNLLLAEMAGEELFLRKYRKILNSVNLDRHDHGADQELAQLEIGMYEQAEIAFQNAAAAITPSIRILYADIYANLMKTPAALYRGVETDARYTPK